MTAKAQTSKMRLTVVMAVILALMGLLIARVGFWNIGRGEWLQEQAEIQWINDTEVAAKRGAIVDRNMNVLAQSAGSDTVVLMPQNIKDAGEVAEKLSQILEMPKAEVMYKASTKTRVGEDGKEVKIGEVWLKRQITNEQSEQIKSLELKGVKLISDVRRFYPNKEFASQVIGYTTMDGEGQTGLERRYNKELEGRQGRMVAETDKFNNDIPNGQEMFIEPVDGENVVLSIDEIVQSFLETDCTKAYTELAPESVQGVVMDVKTGELLGMANIPTFDLNEPPRGDAATLSALSANVVTAAQYQPGGIMTWFTGAAAKDAGIANASYGCTGVAVAESEKILCSANHGGQTFAQAMEHNCAVAGSEMASQLGKQNYYHYLKGFGFGEKTGIDFTSDAAGDVLALKYVTESDVVKMGAGEDMRISQLQLVCAAASLANGGTRMEPRLVLGTSDADGNMLETFDAVVKGQPVSAQTAGEMAALMEENAAGVPEAQLSGYTTGAMYGAVQKYDADGAVMEGEKVSTFIMFAPASNPKYMVMVTLNGVADSEGAATAAAPYAKTVLEETLKYNLIQPDTDGQVQARTPVDDAPQAVTVPNVVEMGRQDAIDTLAAAGLTYVDDGGGTVTAQTPAAGEQVEAGAEISLEMDHKRPADQEPPEDGQAAAAETVFVPDFTGMDFAQARDTALAAGLRFYAKGTGVAVTQNPVAGTVLPKGSAVTVTFRILIDQT